ncbi:hypothetical protein ABZZ20_20360 [Streptomyces sp. NPDC006430]|uniref:hypothetical protein n=1 Tax=Streptomyces sp. NPDC006430 TaxID=3154299 RepID=UPI0033A13BC7
MGTTKLAYLIDLNGQTGTAARPCDQKMDYVLHAKDQVLMPAQVSARVNAHRATGTAFEATVRPEQLTP